MIWKMGSTMCLFLSVLLNSIGTLDGASIVSTTDNNINGTVTEGRIVTTQTVIAEPPASNGNAGLMAQEFNQEMAERAGLPRQNGANRRGQHNEFEWRNPQAVVGTNGLNGQQFFGENENEGNGNGMNGMVNQEFGEFEGPRAIQPVANGNADNGNWNQKDYVWGDYGLEEPNRWKRLVDFEGEGRNDAWDGNQMLNGDIGRDQWNENGRGDYGNERQKRATKMKDVNQWVMRGIDHVNFADIDWAGQIARAIAKWNRIQILANTKSKATTKYFSTPGGVPQDWTVGTATTDIPIGDAGTTIPITGVPTDLPPTTATGGVMGVTDNGIIDIPGTTWSPRQIAAAVDYTWSDYGPGVQPVQEQNGIDYMVDNGQDPEVPPNAVVEAMSTQRGGRQIQLDNGLDRAQGTANELAANGGNTEWNYDYYNADYGLGGNNRNKRAPRRVKSVNEWIVRDIRKVNFADDDWLGQIAMAIAVWNQRHATDKAKALNAGFGIPTTDTTVNTDMNTPGDIPLLVPVQADLNNDITADAAATTIANVPSSMNINAPVFEAATTPVNVPATMNAFIDDPTLGAVNVPSSVNSHTPIVVLPAVPDTTFTNTNTPGDFTLAPTRNIVAAFPSFTTTAIWTANEVRNDQEPIQVIDGKEVGTVGSVIQYIQEPARSIKPFTTGNVADPNPEQTTSAPVEDYLVTDSVPVDLNQINYDAPNNPEQWIADPNRGDYGWGDYAWTENRAVKVDQWGDAYNTQNNADYNYGDYNGQQQLNGVDYIGNGQTNTPDYTGVDYANVDYVNTDYGRQTQQATEAGQWKGDFNWRDYGWAGNTNYRKRREIENEGWWDKRQLKEWANGFDYQLKSGKTKRAATINDLNEWIMSDIGKVNFGDDDWLGQIAMAIVTWRERAMAESGGQTATNGDTQNPIDNADNGAQNVQRVATGTPNPNWSGTTPAVTAIPDVQFGTDAPRALNAPTVPSLNNNVVEGNTQKVNAPRGLRGPWNADYVAGDYSWGKPPLVSPQNIYNGDYNWLDYALGNLLDTGNQGDYNWGAVDYIGQQPTVLENQANPEGNGADVGFETNPKMMDGTNLFNVDYGNTDYGIDGQNPATKANGQIKRDPLADTGNVQQLQEVIGEVNADYPTTTDGAVRQTNAGDRPITGETNWQDNGWQAARQTGTAKWLGDFNWGDYGWGGNTNDRKKREVENEGWWDVRKLIKPVNNDNVWNGYGLSLERVKRAGTNMKIAKAVNEWVLRDINNVNFADDDWPGMIAQSIATWKRHFIKTGHKALGFVQMPHGKAATANGATKTINDGATAIANDGTTVAWNDGINAKADPATPGTTIIPIKVAVDVVSDNGVLDAVTNGPELNNIDGAVNMALNVWKDYGVTNTDYLDYVPETTTFTWTTDTPQGGEWNKQMNFPDWTYQTTPVTNAIDGSPVIDNWNQQINQAGETGQIQQVTAEPATTNAFLGLGEAMNPIRQVTSGLIDASTGENTIVENPKTTQSNIISESNGVPDLPQNITTNQQNSGGMLGELNTVDKPEGILMGAIKAATNTQAESEISNNQSDNTTVVADQRIQSDGAATITDTETNQSFTNTQINNLKKIAAGNGVGVDGAPGDLNEINWFDYAGFGEYEGGVRQLNGVFFQEPAVQTPGAENAEPNDYNWIDYGRSQQFTEYDGPGVEQGVERNLATGVQNEPDYNVFEFSTAGFVDGQNDLQKPEGGNEQWKPSGIVWADYDGNRMKRGVDQLKTSGRTKKKHTLSRNQRIALVHGLQNIFKSALIGHREDTKRIHHQRATTHQTTNRHNLKTFGDIGASRKWLSRRLAAFNVIEDLPLRRHILPSEIDNWWTRKQINGGGRENGRNKRDVFGNKDVGHDVNKIGRRVSMPDTHFRQHEFSSSLLGGRKNIKHQMTDGLNDGDQGNLKDRGWNNGLIFSKTQTNDLKRSTNDLLDPTFVTTGSLANEESTLTNNGVDFRATAPRTVNSKPENDRVVRPLLKLNQNVQITHNVDLPKVFSRRQYRGKALGNVLDAILKIGDAGRGYIESVQTRVDRSI